MVNPKTLKIVLWFLNGKTDCPCHQSNRRTEFKIIGELDAELIYEDERVDDVEEGKDTKSNKGRKGK